MSLSRNIICLLVAVLSPAMAQEKSPTNVFKNVAYVKDGHARQKLDVFLPPNAEAKNPTLVWIHGGAWKEGDKGNCPGLGMLKKGWVVVSLNYRFSQHAIFPAQIEDCKAALRWLRANAAEYKIDPERIAAWGASAGGHLVSLLATTSETKKFDVGEHLDQSSKVNCVINWFGPTDFLHWGGGTIIQPDNKDDVVAKLFGGPVKDNVELAKQGSPITWVSAKSAPVLTMHGDKDVLVPVQQGEIFHAALTKAGAKSELKVYPGQGHGGPKFTDDEALKMMVDFIETHTVAPKPAQK